MMMPIMSKRKSKKPHVRFVKPGINKAEHVSAQPATGIFSQVCFCGDFYVGGTRLSTLIPHLQELFVIKNKMIY